METSTSIDWQTWIAGAIVFGTMAVLFARTFFPPKGGKKGSCGKPKCH